MHFHRSSLQKSTEESKEAQTPKSDTTPRLIEKREMEDDYNMESISMKN